MGSLSIHWVPPEGQDSVCTSLCRFNSMPFTLKQKYASLVRKRDDVWILSCFSRVQLGATPWTVVHQLPCTWDFQARYKSQRQEQIENKRTEKGTPRKSHQESRGSCINIRQTFTRESYKDTASYYMVTKGSIQQEDITDYKHSCTWQTFKIYEAKTDGTEERNSFTIKAGDFNPRG